MSFECPITVQFQVFKSDKLKNIGRQYLALMKEHLDQEDYPNTEEYDRDACRFLEYVAEGKGIGTGPRGDMFTWGSIGNYTSIDSFVVALRPFWTALYAEHALWDFIGIIVMHQNEQDPRTSVYEISKDQTAPRHSSPLILRTQELVSFPLFEGFVDRPEASLPQGVTTVEWTPEND